jgi:hypothetical protein
MILARGTDDPCGCSALAQAVPIPPLGMDDKCCNGRSHDLAIALSKLGLLLVYNLCSGLYATDSYSYVL